MKLNINRQVITQPTSAYDIISREIELILDEPRRVRMAHWYASGALATSLVPDVPSCGTIACAAGWAGHIMGWVPAGVISNMGSGVAHRLAGFSEVAENELRAGFTGGRHYWTKDGTEEQAGAVADWLRGFQKKWEPELRARMIAPGGVVIPNAAPRWAGSHNIVG